MVTIFSCFIYVLALYLFLKHQFLYAVIVLYFRNVLDDVDGILARMTKRKTKTGAILDNFVGGGLFILLTYAVLIYINVPIITLFLLPFFILMGFQDLILRLIISYVNKGRIPTKSAGFMEFMSFQEIRFFAFHILPLFPYIIKLEQVTLPLLLGTLAVLVLVKQLFWWHHYRKDFKGIWIRSHMKIQSKTNN